jgi:uncharacterized membrane protein YecN with MAPEG domain
MTGNASPLEMAAVLTALAVIFYSILGISTVLRRRRRQVYGGKAHVILDRDHRQKKHILPYLLFFIVSVWLFAWNFPKPNWLAILGATWLVGRILYSLEYWLSSRGRWIHHLRSAGSAFSLLAVSLLMLGGAYGIISKEFLDNVETASPASDVKPVSLRKDQ